MYMKVSIRLAAIVFLLSLMPIKFGYTQDGSMLIEEIVVSARKRSESLKDVPISITAFTEETIEKAGIERPSDFISLMPNITIVDSANVGDTQVGIRGVVSTRDAESTFAYVVDGILSTNPNSFNEELVDVRQIEVLKGPQGALYGRNAVSGAILVTTKAPSDEFDAQIKLGGGNAGLAKGSLRLSGPINDSMSGSIAASYREMDGHYANIYESGGSGVDYLQDTTVRARLIGETSNNINYDFRAGHSQVEGGAINFNAVFAIPAFAAGFGPTFFADVNAHDFKFAFNVPGVNEQETNELALKMDIANSWGDITMIASYNDLDEYLLSDGTSATFYGYELTAKCQADRKTINSVARPDLFGGFFQPFGVFPSSDSPPNAEADFTGIYGPYTPTACDGYQYQERNQQDTSFEIKITSPEDQAARWIAGAYASKIDREVVVAYGADLGLGFTRQPYVAKTGKNPTDLLFWDDFDTNVLALFGELTFDISDAMELSLALRWDREKRKVHNMVPNVKASGYNINNAVGSINPGFAKNPNGIPDRSRTFDQWQPKLSWRYSLSEDMNVYASYGVGFRSGGFNSLGSSDLIETWFNTGQPAGVYLNPINAGLTINDTYEKEVSTSYEFGVKYELMDRRLRLNAAIFNNDVEDNQFFEFFAGPFGLMRVVTTIDDINIKGFEFDFNVYANDNLSFFGGIGLLDSIIKKNTNRPLSVGNAVPQAPDRTFNLGSQLDIPVSDNTDFYARLDFQHIGAMWFHTMQGEASNTIWDAFNGGGGTITQNLSNARRDAVNTLNFRMGLNSERWSATAWGKNITDEKYLEEIIPAVEFGGSFVHPAAKAAYGVDLTYRF